MSDPTPNTPDTRTPQIPGVPRPSMPGWQRRTLAGVVATIVVLVLVLVAVAGDGGGSTTAASASSDSPALDPLLDTLLDPSSDLASDEPDGDDAGDDLDDDAEDAFDATDDSAGYPDGGGNVVEPPADSGGGDGPVELDPVGSVDEQCAQALAIGRNLVVTPDPAVLDAGDMTSALTIRNCGDADVDWTAKTVPHVALDTGASTLTAGTTTQLGFTIDADAYEPGAIDFKIKVSEPGANTYVDVHAFRKTFGKDLVAGNGAFSAGADAGGCANSCLVHAVMSPGLASADLGFEVRTHTPATIEVWVGTQPQDGAGAPMAASPAGATQWSTVLAPLEASTEYHLLLRATDANGKVDERSTTFTTITPAKGPGGLTGVDPKCLAQCISKATVTPGDDFSTIALDVTAKVPARFQVRVSTQAPGNVDGVPTFADVDASEISGLGYGTTWSTTVGPLEGDTTYHVIVQAEDVDGHVAHRVGQFHTAPEPTSDVLITFHRVVVTHDGDSSWKNRGELSFAWGVGDSTVGTRGEQKMSDGDSFEVNRSKATYLATGLRDSDLLPVARVSGSERDADGKVEFCGIGVGLHTDWGHSDSCDAKWNVASSGLVMVDSIGSMARCSQYGIGGPTAQDGCIVMETADHGKDYARFQVVVSYHVAG